MNFDSADHKFIRVKYKKMIDYYTFIRHGIIHYMLKALSTNTLVNHPSYGKILTEYNTQLKEKGKVNNKKFYEQIILKEIPTYNIQSWYYFIKRFKVAGGLQAVTNLPPLTPEAREGVEQAVSATLMNNQQATSVGISRALNIASERLRDIMENPQLMSAKDAIDLLFKAMKAQDSRIHAIGKVHEDNREEAKLEKAFSDQAYEE